MNAYIVAGYRSAVGKATRGGFRFTRPDDLGAKVIKYLLEKLPELDPARVDDVIVGNAVPEAEQGMQMGRYVALLALPKKCFGYYDQPLLRLGRGGDCHGSCQNSCRNGGMYHSRRNRIHVNGTNDGLENRS